MCMYAGAGAVVGDAVLTFLALGVLLLLPLLLLLLLLLLPHAVSGLAALAAAVPGPHVSTWVMV